MDMPILTCTFFTFNWLTMTSEMRIVKFHPEVASCLLSRGKRKYAPLGMEYYIMKVHKKLFSCTPFNFTLFVISPKLQRIWSWNFGFAIRNTWAFIGYQIKKIYSFRLSPGDENVIGIRAFNFYTDTLPHPDSSKVGFLAWWFGQ